MDVKPKDIRRRKTLAVAPEKQKRKHEDPIKTSGTVDPNDVCLDVHYACNHYGDCCGHGNYKKAGHKPVCSRAKPFTVGGNCAAIGTHEGEM